MCKTYYVHLIFGKRYDGTRFMSCGVDSVFSGEPLLVKEDKKTEFYTEEHNYIFMGSKKACEEYAEGVNDGAKESGRFGDAGWGAIKIDGVIRNVEYDYRRGIKTVYYSDNMLGSVNFDMKTGEEIKDLGREYEKARKLVDEHDKIVNALTTNNNEKTRAVIRDSDFKTTKSLANHNNEGRY